MADNDPALGRGRWVEKTVLEIFQDWTFLPQLEQIFLSKSSANTDYLKKSDASSTYLTQSNASSTYATKSEIATKQNTIPNFSVKTTQTMYGLTVTTYSDGLNVYLKISGTLNGSSDLATNNRVNIGTLSNTNYAPPSEMQTTVHSANAPNWSRLTVFADGRVFIQIGSSSTTLAIEGSFYYPLKSRIP